MSHAINKIKDALHPNKTKTPNDHNNSNSDPPATNPSGLHSTQHGIHGQRDTATSLHPKSEEVRRLDVGIDSARGVGGLTPANTRTGDSLSDELDASSSSADAVGLEDDARAVGGAQYTHHDAGDAALQGSDLSGAGAGRDKADAGRGGVGTGLDGSARDDRDGDEDIEGEGLTSDHGEEGSNVVGGRGEGLVDERSRRDESDEVAGSGLSGAERRVETGGYGADEAGSGLDGVRVSGGSRSGSHGGESERLHHWRDGHGEDTLHAGPHVTMAAKALDPNSEFSR